MENNQNFYDFQAFKEILSSESEEEKQKINNEQSIQKEKLNNRESKQKKKKKVEFEINDHNKKN